ncbi:ClpP/crotonase-like domain-containing protein [Cunninghamella echinulata]|nr:ClpP/crotonase-like domain-containing protein [Cunninghamella echinulata]
MATTKAVFPQSFPSEENAKMTLHKEGDVFILHLHHKDNRFDTEFCKSILLALQTIEDIFVTAEETLDMALVTVGDGKIFSNGLDLGHAVSYTPFMDVFLSLLKKLVSFCIPTIAALNGHAFAGGCMFAMAHDYRVMRSDRGYICMNEVEFGAPLHPGMSAVLEYKLQPTVFRDMVLRAYRFPAKEALEKGIVDAIAPENEVLPTAKAFAAKLAPLSKSAGPGYKQLKDQVGFI